MIKRKKAQVLVYGLIFGFFIAIGTFYMASYLKELPKEYLGEKSLELLKTASEAERALLYIDLSARYAAKHAIMELGNSGGFYKAECGKYIGYFLLNNENNEVNDCFPDYKGNLKSIFNTNLNSYLLNYPLLIPINNYEIRLKQNGKLQFHGIALSPLEITRIVIEKEPIRYIIPEGAEEVIKKIIATYGSDIELASEPYGIEEPLIVAVISQESKGDPAAISATGCAGLMQFCYATASDFIDIFGKLTPCACAGEVCQIRPACNENNDGRLNPKKSINAGAKYLSQLEEGFKKYTYKEEFAVASYNGGASVIKNAIKKTGKDDPTWNEVEKELTYDLITYFDSESEKKNKVNEIKDYVLKVSGYKEKYAEIEKAEESKITAGAVMQELEKEEKDQIAYYIKPSFKTEINYNLDDYEIIKESAKEIINNIEVCEQTETDSGESVSFENCLKVELARLNKETGLDWSIDCEKGEQKIFDDFVEYFISCKDSGDDNCYCQHGFINGQSFTLSRLENDALISSEINNKEFQETIKNVNLEDENVVFASGSSYLKKADGEITAESYWPGDQCTLAEKRAYKFCVDTNKKINDENVIIKFALYFP